MHTQEQLIQTSMITPQNSNKETEKETESRTSRTAMVEMGYIHKQIHSKNS